MLQSMKINRVLLLNIWLPLQRLYVLYIFLQHQEVFSSAREQTWIGIKHVAVHKDQSCCAIVCLVTIAASLFLIAFIHPR